jgi:S1-C subfamily serine protease
MLAKLTPPNSATVCAGWFHVIKIDPMTDAASKSPAMSTNKATPPASLGIQDYVITPQGGALIRKLDKFGSCGKAGIVVGDEIQGLNGMRLPAEKPAEWTGEVCKKIGVGGTVNVHILRGGKQMVVPVKLVARKVLSLDLEEVSEVLERKISPSST